MVTYCAYKDVGMLVQQPISRCQEWLLLIWVQQEIGSLTHNLLKGVCHAVLLAVEQMAGAM